MESHLLQMRGLKRKWQKTTDITVSRIFYRCVDWNPPYSRLPIRTWNVASFTDAWIETENIMIRSKWRLCRIFYRCVDWNSVKATWGRLESHLLQMRGLKHLLHDGRQLGKRRIFYRCVDWNVERQVQDLAEKSHLLQMRGLKLTEDRIEPCQYESHLLQMRGLKPVLRPQACNGRSRIFYRCVDWNMLSCLAAQPDTVASFTDAWIET